MTLSLDKALTGISGILVTPYAEDGEIAPERLSPILDRALNAGVHMPVVNGNTGEFYALTTDEAVTMAREVFSMVAGRAPVLAGVGRGIRDAQKLAKASAEAGAAALMVHQPFIERFAQRHGQHDVSAAAFDAPASLANGRSGLSHLLREGFSGGVVFCSSDLLAHGVLIEAHARGLAVPADIAVIGFGDQDYAANVDPSLTTVRVDREALGAAAAEAILSRLKGDDRQENVVDIGFHIIRRNSA